MNWINNRPENWKNPYLKSNVPEWEEIRKAYEAGADAMLEALRVDGIKFEAGVYARGETNLVVRVLQMRGIRAGNLVFIEDKK